jgi:hypothetical protein
VLAGVRQEAYRHGRDAARDAGLDPDTADAVGHAFAARVFDEQLVGRAMARALAEEIQKHAQP